MYTFKEIEFAIGHFVSSSLIEGSVYCGKINGDLVAVHTYNGDVSKDINTKQDHPFQYLSAFQASASSRMEPGTYLFMNMHPMNPCPTGFMIIIAAKSF